MKKILIFALFCACVFYAHALHAVSPTNEPVKQYGQLQVKGAQLCDQRGNPVILRGVSLG